MKNINTYKKFIQVYTIMNLFVNSIKIFYQLDLFMVLMYLSLPLYHKLKTKCKIRVKELKKKKGDTDLHTKRKVRRKRERERGGEKSEWVFKNDECRKKELCPSVCLIRTNGWTDYHSRNTLQRERKSVRGRNEGDSRGRLEINREEVRKDGM